MSSTNIMLKKCAGLVGTRDVSEWEDQFLRSVLERTDDGNRPDRLSEKQIDVLQRIYDKHFAG